MSTRRKLLLLAALYLAQGLPYGFFTQALPVLLRELDVSLRDIGLSSLLALPWALKFAWAPAVDRLGTRRGWILAMQALATLLAVGLAILRPDAGSSLMPLLVAVLLTNLVAATQDIATDGLAVSMLSREERGLGNGVQVGGYRVGMILGGGLLLVVFDRFGWTPTLLGMALLIAASSVPLWQTRTLPPAPPIGGGQPWSWLQRKGAWPWIAVLVAFKVGDYLAQGMLRPWMVDGGMSKTEIGLLMGTAGFTAGLVGALAGGALIQPMGRRRSLIGFAALQVTGVAAYGLCVAGDVMGTGLWAAVVYEHFVGGLATAALFTAMMDASRPEQASTDYTLQASIVVFASGAASALSGYGAEALGYAGLFALGTALAVLGPALAAVPGCTAITQEDG